MISGLPTGAGTFQFHRYRHRQRLLTAKQQFTIVDLCGLAITYDGIARPRRRRRLPRTRKRTLRFGDRALHLKDGNAGAPLPTGLSLDPTSGTISGTPSAAGSATVTIQVTDSTNASSSSSFTLTVISASFTGLAGTATYSAAIELYV